MKIILSILFSCFFIFSAFAQTVLIEVDVEVDTTESNYNVNSRHYTYPYFSVRYPLGEFSNNIVNMRSPAFEFGFDYKLKFSKNFSMLNGLSLEFLNAKIHQDAFLTQNPTSFENVREAVRRFSLNYNFAFRTNFDGGRGQMPGTYLDLGVQPGYYFHSAYFFRYKDLAGGKLQSKVRIPENWDPLSLRVFARLGTARSALKASWQIAPQTSYPVLPLFLIGFEHNWM